MDYYIPPYTISDKMLANVCSISEKLGRLKVYGGLESKPQLRRNNRIRSIHASLMIEANSLSEGNIREILNNKEVIGPEKEILEVKNAFAAYELMEEVNPYSISDLKKIHSIMTHNIVEESGCFRKGNEGVFAGDRGIFMAPPPEMVSPLITQLLAWLEKQQGVVHPLISSCIFHYEFVFIHPFSDGNGRMARLWQNVILSAWNPIFRYIPIESQIAKFQEDYYRAIGLSNAQGNSNPFIEFMLSRIDEILDFVLQQNLQANSTSAYVAKLLQIMEYQVSYSTTELLALLNLKSKETLRRHYIGPALQEGLIEMTMPDKPTSRNQRYIKK